MNDDKNLQDDQKVSEDASIDVSEKVTEQENAEAPNAEEDIASAEAQDVEEKIEPETLEPEKLTAEQIKEDNQMAPVEDPDEELEKAKKVLNASDPNDPAKWYIVHTYSGHENKVAKSIKQRVQSLGFENRIFDIIVPTRNTIKVSQGKKETVKEKIFPGYVLVKMALDDESWLLIRTTQGVTAFIGAGNKPTPISDKEVAAIQKFMNEDEPLYKTSFILGEAVKIVDGPFADFLGTIDDIDDAKGKLKVLVSIFGRETPVELDFLQVNKL
jgi:transcription termination/antitermination protein NusG